MNSIVFWHYNEREEIYDIENGKIGEYWKILDASINDITKANITSSDIYGVILNIKNPILKEKLKLKMIDVFKNEPISVASTLIEKDIFSIEEKKSYLEEKIEKLLTSNEIDFNFFYNLKDASVYINIIKDNEFIYKILNKIIEKCYSHNKIEIIVSIIEKYSDNIELYNKLLKHYDDYLPVEYKEYIKANNDSNYISKRENVDIDIGIDSKIKIGLEIETNSKYPYNFNVSRQKGYERYKTKTDATVPNGIEVECPIIHNTKEDVSSFCKLCDSLSNMGYYYDESNGNASGQINLGLDYLDTAKSIQTFYEIYCNCEELLYYISSEEGQVFRQDVYLSSRIKPISEAIGKRIFDEDITREEIIDFFQNKDDNIEGIYYKKNSVCLRGNNEDDLRFEFRIPNGGVNYKTWIDNIRLYGKIMEVSKKIALLYDKNQLTKEDEKLLTMKFNLEDNLGLEEKLVILMNMLFEYEEIRNIYYNRFISVKRQIQEGLTDHYDYKPYELSFDKVEFKEQYNSKIDEATITYDPLTDEYIDYRKR